MWLADALQRVGCTSVVGGKRDQRSDDATIVAWMKGGMQGNGQWSAGQQE